MDEQTTAALPSGSRIRRPGWPMDEQTNPEAAIPSYPKRISRKPGAADAALPSGFRILRPGWPMDEQTLSVPFLSPIAY